MKKFAKLFSLKPYGSELLDGVAEVWLLFAALNIASIALCDALAWGYFAYTTATGYAAYLAAAVAGVVVLMLVGSVDAMFVMHDRTRRTKTTASTDQAPTFRGRIRGRLHRDHVAIVARIILVILTFTVTAPFLTQLFFARDIESTIRRRNEQTVATARARMIASFDTKTSELRAQLSARQRDLATEIAGAGSSGRYGRGPTAEAIEAEVRSLERHIVATNEAKAAETGAFDRAVGTSELANRYGVDIVEQGPDTRASVIAELERSASFRATRRTIKAFLIFMFLGLVCLKLFQPESVRIYYNARLQAAYARMRAGAFDHRLDPRERSAAGGMNPIRFADWYENDQEVRDATDRLRDQTASAIERLKTQEEALRVLHETLHADMSRMQSDLESSRTRSEELERQVATYQNELSALNAKIAEEQQALDDFRFDLAGDLPLRDQQLLISSRTRTVKRLAERRSAAAGLTVSLQRATRELDSSRVLESQLREALHAVGSEVAVLTKSLQKARQRRAMDILEA